MLMAYLTLATGLLISAVAIFYSVAGLISIFSAAPIAIIIMGTVLEVSKLVATVWIKQNWTVAPRLLKAYLLSAVAILMLITSMGIFGFLSKAHSDQTLVSGDVQSKIAVYDERIKTSKDNIEASRKALQQMDMAVDQVMSRSTTETGADKAVALRRTQAKERSRLQAEIAAEQKIITQQQELRAPIAAEVRKVEAEVGPIKYIASFIYGDNPDANVLEKAVTWVIILIVVVFDPLAVMLLLASQYSFGLLRRKDDVVPITQDMMDETNRLVKDVGVDLDNPLPDDLEEWFEHAHAVAKSIDNGTYQAPGYEPDDGPLTDDQIKQIREIAGIDLPTGEVIVKTSLFPDVEEEFPFKGKGLPPSMPLTASYMQPKEVDPVVETNPLAMDERPGDYVELPETTITHTANGMIIEDSAGTQEIPTYNLAELKNMIDQYGYTIENGTAKIHGVEVPESVLASLLDAGYVQNEEQKESGQWSKILNKAITEEEYLKAVRQNNKEA